jgi:hypothetical protein
MASLSNGYELVDGLSLGQCSRADALVEGGVFLARKLLGFAAGPTNDPAQGLIVPVAFLYRDWESIDSDSCLHSITYRPRT